MSSQRVFTDLYRLTMPTPFAVGDVHAYLLLGDPLTLVDTGVHTPASEQALRAGLASIGLSPADLEQIVLTHSHVDHIGQASWLKEVSAAAVFAYPLAVAKVADLEAFARQAILWNQALLPAAGVPVELQIVVEAFYNAIPRLADNVTVDHQIGEGDTLFAGGRAWRVLFCPGHSSDLICLYDPEKRHLIGSDHLLPSISSNALLEPPRPDEQERRKPLLTYWRSLERLADLPIDYVLPGHGELITDHVSLLERRRRQRDRRLADIEILVSVSPRTVWQIAEELFSRLAGADVFLAVSEVVGHLDMLIAQGRIALVDEGPPWRYGVTAG